MRDLSSRLAKLEEHVKRNPPSTPVRSGEATLADMAQWFEQAHKEWEAEQALPKRVLLAKRRQELRELEAEARKPKRPVQPHPDPQVRAANEILGDERDYLQSLLHDIRGIELDILKEAGVDSVLIRQAWHANSKALRFTKNGPPPLPQEWRNMLDGTAHRCGETVRGTLIE